MLLIIFFFIWFVIGGVELLFEPRWGLVEGRKLPGYAEVFDDFEQILKQHLQGEENKR